MSGSKHENDLQQSNAPPHDPSVSVDIDTLSLLVVSNKDSTPTPRLPLQRTLSRKQPVREEVAVGDTMPPAPKIPSLVVGAMGSSPVTVNVETDDKFPLLPPVLTHQANRGGSVRSRRALKRRRSPCNDPLAVLLLFMILSSVGSLLILFLTFYGGKVNGGNGQ